MKPLLITDYGTCLKTIERRLVLVNQDSGERREWLPVDFPFDSVIVENLGGFVTFPALRWLASNGVTLTALDFNGSLLASYLPEVPFNPYPRISQMAAFLWEPTRVEVARFVLESKLGVKVPTEFSTLNDLLTFEAREAVRFYADLGITRDYPKARDPINAVLNYAFGLLGSRARFAIHRACLDPLIGFLHAPQKSKSALVYDVMEPFRAETVKLALRVREELTLRDFSEMFGFGLRLRPEGAHRLVEAFARSLREEELARFTYRLTLRFGSPVLRQMFPTGHRGPNRNSDLMLRGESRRGLRVEPVLSLPA